MNGRKREGISDLPRIKPIASAVLAAAAALLSATAAAVLGSWLLLCLAGAAMAYLFAANRSFAAFLSLPASYLFAYLFTGDAIRSLTALLSVPIGLVLALCIFRKAPLSITVASLTPVIAVCAGALMCYWLSHIYDAAVLESFKLYKADIASYYDRAAGYITSVTGDDGTSLVSRDTLDAVVSSMKLIIPSASFWHTAAQSFSACFPLFSRPTDFSTARGASELRCPRPLSSPSATLCALSPRETQKAMC